MEKPKKRLEKDIQLEICKYLDSKGYFFWRQNTGGLYDPIKKIFRKLPLYAKPGVPDIILVRSGCFIGLEVKTDKTKQSQKQGEFQEGLEYAGGEYYVVRSVEDIQNLGL